MKNASGSAPALQLPVPSIFFIFLLCATYAPAGDWPQFMGPNGDGTSVEKGLIKVWPADGPKVLWTVKLGPGYGGAAIVAGQVYLLDRVDKEKDVLRCLDLATGKEQWTFSYDAPGGIDHEGSRSTPAVGKDSVYIIGPFGHLHCIDRATHQAKWKKNILADYGGKRPNWAVAQSPLLYKNLLIVAPQAANVGMVALDQASGQERWRSASIGPMAYGSPMLVNIDGVDQFVLINTLGAAAVSAEGKVLWKYAHPCKIPIPNVTSLGGGKLFVTGAYGAGSAIIQASKQSDGWNTIELARNKQIGAHCHPALLFQNYLYVLCNVNERSDGLVCFDQQANVVWQTKNSPNLDKGGSLLTADGVIYIMDGRSGELHIVEPSPDGFKSLSKAKILEGHEIWGPLALADGKLVLRDQTQVKCINLQIN